MTRLIDLTNQRHGKVFVIERVPRQPGENGPAKWRCLCDCGKEGIYYGASIRAGLVCQCTHTGGQIKHGHTVGRRKSGAFQAWANMIQRATNPNGPRWMDYGGRGIGVCEPWLSFENFYADMGDRPQGMTLERNDNDLGYGPDNCRWATNEEQQRNKRPRGTGWKARQSRSKHTQSNSGVGV